ncbi:MAG TPA: S41 family peptidase [Armatimonadota bacterium]|nr:S41 family peptidase [Armatimonadota bacterium]
MRLHHRLLVVFVLISAALWVLPAVCFGATVKERQETFEIVWSRVNERYYDPSFNGVDWNAVKKRYSARLAFVKTDDELYVLLNQMLGELGRSHFTVIPPSVYVDEEAGQPGDADIGATIQLVGNKPTITFVHPGSSAEEAELRPGYILTKVDDKSLAEVQSKIATRNERPAMTKFLIWGTTKRLLSGREGTEVSIEYLDEDNEPHKVTLKRKLPYGEPIKMGELPMVYGWVKSEELQDGIGYIRFNIFLMPLLEQIISAVKSFKDSPGVIIDLRGNPGGLGAMAMPIARLFYKEQVNLGDMNLRSGVARFPVFPVDKPFTGTLIFLVDETSASTSEILAGGMQDNGRAIVVGRTSVGAVMPSVVEKLPIGARLQYAVADFRTPKGVMLEGRGVIPDFVVEPTRRELLAGKDPILDKAVKLILEHRASGNSSLSGTK